MEQQETIDIETLTQDQHNFNRGTEEGGRLMEKSLKELGAGRSILIDKDGNIIAGNKTQLAAIKAGIKKVRVIESDGTELIAVKRTDVEIDSKQGRELALADNLTTQINLSWDNAELTQVADEQGIELQDWGIDPAGFEVENGEMEDDAEEIERKRKEFEERMANGENLEEDEEYQAFKEKFELKKTTDDCYTPELVYEAVADWVAKEYGLNRRNFVRPFYPGGDYKKGKYPASCIVVDNPPFSILAEILQFYTQRGIRFFLFGPSLTLIGSTARSGCCAISVGVPVTYANGANVSTSFVTNLEPDLAIRTAPSLYKVVDEANARTQAEKHVELPKYRYPDHIVTVAALHPYSRLGIEFRVPKSECIRVTKLDAQNKEQVIFGSGYLISDRLAEERKRLAEERRRIEEEEAEKRAIVFELSDREKTIIQELNKKAQQQCTKK